MIIPPDILKKILNKVTEDIRYNARLRLSEDPKTNIWAYYSNIKLTPIILQDYLMLIPTVPLVDQSLQMELYKVYNLPMLHVDYYIIVRMPNWQPLRIFVHIFSTFTAILTQFIHIMYIYFTYEILLNVQEVYSTLIW